MNSNRKILIASDHAGFVMKSSVIEYLAKQGDSLRGSYDFVDLGTDGLESVDYPDYARKLCEAITEGNLGILICGSGVGMSIAANRFSHIRAALCTDSTTARLSRQHNDANVLCIGARIVGIEVALEMITAFIATPFEGGRHQRRVEKINAN
jgi:ribose 5-phosphate isomerase B